MTLRRFTKSVDGSIPVQALLYNDEDLFTSQDGVGIYDGTQKSPAHQSGVVYATTHRLFYIDRQNELTCSFVLDLSHITQTEYYAGLFKSSAKVTLHLSGANASNGSVSSTPVVGSNDDTVETGFESWECQVCAYRNPPGLSPAAARICGLCGVPRSSMPEPVKLSVPSSNKSIRQEITSLSSSLPSSATASAPSVVSPRPVHVRKPSSIACPACTFLNHPSMRSCEICGTDLPRIQVGQPEMKSAPASRPTSPDTESDDEDGDGQTPKTRMMKLSFRKGGDKAFYAVLKRSLQGKAWEIKHPSGTPSNDTEFNRSGISGIIRTVEASAQNRDTHMFNAFQDLEALMVKAKDMVRLAADLNERLTASSTITSTALDTSRDSPTSSVTTLISPSHTEPEEATFIRSSLSQLGLQMTNTPVTLDMMKDERKWFEELAKELAGVLQGQGQSMSVGQKTTEGGMMKQRGIIALDEAWGGWNRARGVALIPPSTFLQVLPHLPAYTTPPITKRRFKSGLAVLHTPPYSSAAFAARLCGLLTLVGPKTTTEIAEEESMTVGLAGEMMGSVEETGDICRDDGSAAIREGREERGEIERVVGSGEQGLGEGMIVAGEVRWWPNLFLGYKWDGQLDYVSS
ncbi:hypothetical protein K435DRAFT_869276 [Dendrothele bispora CBS 962.96]|uniref:Vacuolar protein-sorting-associated protein 36 n=1 Tax=Dendrothele bispora (strain CBS 962.96) TaxID=1314807 RepID=A0A4S8LAV6_DENBC|nr:hypothetical protein K435DRAFT_869276 [Dendrothele bispora CBS 962.96]